MSRKLVALLLSFAMVFSLVPQIAFAAGENETSETRDSSAANNWQVVNAGGESEYTNAHLYKTVEATGTENEFLVRLAVDGRVEQVTTSTLLTSTLESLVDNENHPMYYGSNANMNSVSGFQADPNEEQPSGAGAIAATSSMPKVSPITGEERKTVKCEIEINYKGNLIAEPVIATVVPNAALYLKVGNQYIMFGNVMDNNSIGYFDGKDDQIEPLTPDENGIYHITIDLTTMAYNAIISSLLHEENSETTTTIFSGEAQNGGIGKIYDTLGNYIQLNGTPTGVSGLSGYSQNGQLLTFNIAESALDEGMLEPPTVPAGLRPDPDLSSPTTTSADGTTRTTVEVYVWTDGNGVTHNYEVKTVEVTTNGTEGEQIVTTITSSWWVDKMVDITYPAKLDVTKANFVTGTAYNVNESAYLDISGNPTFPVPTVKGALYDLSFKKVDESGAAMSGVTFTLAGAKTYTAESESDGTVSFTVPWGEYDLTETPPEGFAAAGPWSDLQIGLTDWPANLTAPASSGKNYVYRFAELKNGGETVVENLPNRIIVTKVIVAEGLLNDNKDQLQHEIYLALLDRSGDDSFLRDSSGAVICQKLVIENGVVSFPEDGKVVFEGVPTGSLTDGYSVWELSGDPGTADDATIWDEYWISTPEVISEATEDHPGIEIKGISTSGYVTFASSNEQTVTITNTYAYHNGLRDVTVRKAWAKNDGSPIDPPDATVEFTLYRKIGANGSPEAVGSPIILDGTKDTTDTVKTGESAPWEAKWVDLPLLDEDGNSYIYMVKETGCSDSDFQPYGSEYQTNVDGGTIYNRRQSTDITVTKIVTDPISADVSFAFTATYGDTTKSFTLPIAGETGELEYSYVLEKVPVGAKVTVSETKDADFTTTATGPNGTFDSASNTYAFTAAEDSTPVVFTNVRTTGSLTITKTVNSDVPADLTAEYEVVVTLRVGDAAVTGTYGGKTFTVDGATFKVKAGTPVVIDGLPSGVTYTVMETGTGGLTPVQDCFTGTISSTASSADFVNERETGDLTIIKYVESPIDTDLEKEFSFRISLRETDASVGTLPITKTYGLVLSSDGAEETEGTVSFTSGSATITLVNGQQATILGLPADVYFEVVEVDYVGFTPDPFDETNSLAEVTGTIPAGEAAVAEFVNTRDMAILKIEKVLGEGSEEVTIPADTTFTITGTSASGEEIKITITFADLTNAEKNPVQLPIGTYSVEENGADVKGYILTVDYSAESVTLTKENNKETITVTNTYEFEKGTLVITKEVSGLQGNDAMPANTTFVVTGFRGMDMIYGPEEVVYSKFTDGVYKMEVPVGRYVVEEIGGTVPGYTKTGVATGETEVTAEKDGSVTLTNIYALEEGELTLIKEAFGLSEGKAVPATAEFKITGTPTAAGATFTPVTVTYADFTNGKYTRTVPVGTYKVEESKAGVDGYTLTVTYSGNGTVTAPLVETSRATADEPVGTLIVTNTYEVEYGTLVITKEATGLQGTDKVPDTTEFVITGKPTSGVEFKKETVSFDKFTDGKYTMSVPVGTYSVEENGSFVDGYEVEVSYSGDGVVTAETDGTLKVTNAYTVKETDLVITKVAEGLKGTDTVPATATFTISGKPTADVPFETVTVKYSDFVDGVYTKKVPVGTYEVTESKAEVPGYTLATTINSPVEVTVDGGRVTVTNTYTFQEGTLTIVKEAKGLVGSDTVPETAAFKITGTPTAKGVTFTPVTVTYDKFTNGEYSLTVPVGTYSVEESNAEVDGYKLTVTYSGNGTVTADEVVTSRAAAEDPAGTLIVSNAYELEYGTLVINKEVSGLREGDTMPATAEFVVTGFRGTETIFDSYVVYYSQFKNGAFEMEVPVGHYVVEELYATVPGYTRTGVDKDETDVTAEIDGEVTLTNIYAFQEGKLTLVKKAVGLEGTDVVPDEALFEISGTPASGASFTPITVTYGDFTDGKYVTTVPIGTYKVTEKGAGVKGYSLEVSYSDPAVVTMEQEGTLTVTNTYEVEYGTLTIVKEASGLQGSDTVPEDATFTITGKPDANVTFEDVVVEYSKFENGSYSLKVPAGKYEVAETKADVEGYTLTVAYSGNGTVTADQVVVSRAAADEPAGTLVVTNTYEVETGELTVEKTISGLQGTDTVSDELQFLIVGSPDASIDFEAVSVYYSQFENGKYKLTVPAGKYWVYEDYAEVDGYTLRVEFSEDAVVSAEEPGTYTITNIYSVDVQQLVIVKEVYGLEGTDKVPEDAAFTITGTPDADIDFEPVTVQYSEFEDGVYTLDVPVGTYEVAETKAEVDGYKLTVSYSGNGTVPPAPTVRGTRSDEPEGVLVVTNTYEVAEAELVIEKVIKGLEGNDTVPEDLAFTISGTPLADIGFKEVSVPYSEFKDGKYTLIVPVGTYTVEENSANVYGYEVEVSYSKDAEVTEEAGGTLTVTNTYTVKEANLVITKVAEGLQGTDTVPADATFTITGTPIADVAFEAVTVTYSELEEGVYTLKVPVGTYEVAESKAEVDGYTLTTEIPNPVEVTVDGGRVTVTNIYELQKATLKLTKVVSGLQGSDTVPGTATFTIKGTPKADIGFDDVTVTYAELQSGSYELEVPVGTYTVTESGAEVGSYSLSTEYSAAAEATAGQTAELKVTNTYTYLLTQITITKVWDDQNNKYKARPDSVTAVLYANGRVAQRITLDKSNSFTATLTVPIYENGQAITYTVDEQNVKAGYVKTVSGDAANGFTITNKFQPTFVDPPVGKKVTGDTPETPETFTFKLKAISTTAKALNGVLPMPAAAGNAQEMTITIVGEGAKEFGEFPLVEVGNYTYEITEVKNDAAGYTYDETVFVVVYKVSAHPTTNALVCNMVVNGKPVDGDYVSEVTFNNKYEKPSVSIDVSKVWADSDNESGKRPDSITVKLIADGKETGKTLTLNAGVNWAGTFEGLDKFNAEGKEIVYLVQEVPVDGYTIDIFGDAATGFQIKNTIIEEEAPPTGVPAGLLGWVCGLIGSMICLASFTVVLRKKKVEGR